MLFKVLCWDFIAGLEENLNPSLILYYTVLAMIGFVSLIWLIFGCVDKWVKTKPTPQCYGCPMLILQDADVNVETQKELDRDMMFGTLVLMVMLGLVAYLEDQSTQSAIAQLSAERLELFLISWFTLLFLGLRFCLVKRHVAYQNRDSRNIVAIVCSGPCAILNIFNISYAIFDCGLFFYLDISYYGNPSVDVLQEQYPYIQSARIGSFVLSLLNLVLILFYEVQFAWKTMVMKEPTIGILYLGYLCLFVLSAALIQVCILGVQYFDYYESNDCRWPFIQQEVWVRVGRFFLHMLFVAFLFTTLLHYWILYAWEEITLQREVVKAATTPVCHEKE